MISDCVRVQLCPSGRVRGSLCLSACFDLECAGFDGALDCLVLEFDPKRRRRFALPPHSKNKRSPRTRFAGRSGPDNRAHQLANPTDYVVLVDSPLEPNQSCWVAQTSVCVAPAAKVQSRDATSQIFKFHFNKACIPHHCGQFRLVRKVRNRVGQILVSAA